MALLVARLLRTRKVPGSNPTVGKIFIRPQQRLRGYSNAAIVCGWVSEWVCASRNSVGGDIVMRPFVCGWVSEWVRASVCRALPCGHDKDYSFCPITFKLHMLVVDDERRNRIDFGTRGQRARSAFALCV